MPSSMIDFLRDSARNGVYFRANEILRSPNDAFLAVKYYDACCEKAKKQIEKWDLPTILYCSKIRYAPVNETKKYFKWLRSKKRQEETNEVEACC